MKIKDTERLLASHTRLINAACGLELATHEVWEEVVSELEAAVAEARQLRTELGRPLP